MSDPVLSSFAERGKIKHMGKPVQVYFSQSLSYGTLAKPATHIINRKGDLAGKVMGPRNRHSAEAKEFFRQLLAEKT